MKIIHLISGGDVGGAKTHVLSLLQGLSRTHTVLLVCFMEGEFAQDARDMGIQTRIIKSRNVLADCRTIAGLIRSEGFQVVHCHGSRANMMGALLRRRIDAPVVTTVHSDYRLDYLGRPLHRLTFGTINTVALRFLDYYIGVSEAMAELLIRRGFDAQRMFAIYNGVDFSTQRQVVERETFLDSIGLKRKPDSVIFGIAARISPVKDMGTLVRAFAETVREYPAARLVIAGDGEQRTALEALAKELCPADSVLFAGWMEDVDSFYNALDVNLLTSLSETFPYALTEGARMRCATVASRVGGIPYLIDDGENGLLFPAQDVGALAERMKCLAADGELRQRLGQRLYEKTKAQFSVEATVRRQEEIYAAILRRTARRSKQRDGVLICGAYGKRNAGDDAILRAIVGQLRDIDPDLPIYALSRHPKETRLAYRIGSCHTFNALRYLRIMRRTRLYISGGGTLIQNVTSGRSLLYYLSNISRAHAAGNHVMMYGCGIGPVTGKLSRRMTARTIERCVDTVTLRDADSAEELRSMGVERPDVHLTADPALLLEGPAPEKAAAALRALEVDPEGSYVMFALRPWPGVEAHMEDFAAAAVHAHELGYTPVLFSLEPQRDAPVSEKLAGLLPFDCIQIPGCGDADAILALIGRMKAVVSMRLHALIFAFGQGVPLAGVVYDPKVSGFLDYMGQKNYVNLNELSAGALTGLLDAALGGSADPETRDRMRALAEENKFYAQKALEE
jgi:polysaccharide pyruvyl transferase CsaB